MPSIPVPVGSVSPSRGHDEAVFCDNHVHTPGALEPPGGGARRLDEPPPGAIGEGIAEASRTCVALLTKVDDGIDYVQ